MIPKRIEGTTHYLGAPEGWAFGEHHAHLSVRVGTLGGKKVYESAWELTPAETVMNVQGGTVILRCVGLQPPVALYVEAAPPVNAD